MLSNRILSLIGVTYELASRELSPVALMAIQEHLGGHKEGDIEAALVKCQKEGTCLLRDILANIPEKSQYKSVAQLRAERATEEAGYIPFDEFTPEQRAKIESVRRSVQ